MGRSLNVTINAVPVMLSVWGRPVRDAACVSVCREAELYLFTFSWEDGVCHAPNMSKLWTSTNQEAAVAQLCCSTEKRGKERLGGGTIKVALLCVCPAMSLNKGIPAHSDLCPSPSLCASRFIYILVHIFCIPFEWRTFSTSKSHGTIFIVMFEVIFLYRLQPSCFLMVDSAPNSG